MRIALAAVIFLRGFSFSSIFRAIIRSYRRASRDVVRICTRAGGDTFHDAASARRLRNGILRPMTEGVILAAIAYSVLASHSRVLLAHRSCSAYFSMQFCAACITPSTGCRTAWMPCAQAAKATDPHDAEAALALIPAIAGLILTRESKVSISYFIVPRRSHFSPSCLYVMCRKLMRDIHGATRNHFVHCGSRDIVAS